jgi:ABC-type uncharacterized transport system substrate-binding protein
VAILARHGGNITGLELPTIELAGKCLELFKAAVPTISCVAVLVDPAELPHAHVPSHIEREARVLGIQLQRVEAGAPATFEAAFAAIVHSGADALMIMDAVLFTAHRQQLLALALRHRLPTMAYGGHLAEAGSLLACGADHRELCQRSAVFVHKILKGAKPAALPIERAKFQLVSSLRTAQLLGLTIPPTLLFQAIVAVGTGDPVGTGLIARRARPGGNVTGSSILEVELAGKRLELLKEAIPQMSRVAVLWDPANPGSVIEWRKTQAAAQALGLQLQSREVRGLEDFESAFAAMTRERPDALFIVGGSLTSTHRERITSFAAQRRMSYGASSPAMNWMTWWAVMSASS